MWWPEAREVAGDQAHDLLGVPPEPSVAVGLGIVGPRVELVGQQGQRLVDEAGATVDAAVEPFLERSDAIEGGAMSARLEDAGADRVGDGDEGDQAGADVVVTERQPGNLALPDAAGPGPGEAVGLLLGIDRRHVAIEVAGAELHGVAEFVGQDDGDDRRAEPLGEFEDDPELAVVVRHVVAVWAVERSEVADLLIARVAREAAAGDRRGAFRVGGEDPAGQRYPWFPIEP